jgi:hypothetical protein
MAAPYLELRATALGFASGLHSQPLMFLAGIIRPSMIGRHGSFVPIACFPEDFDRTNVPFIARYLRCRKQLASEFVICTLLTV